MAILDKNEEFTSYIKNGTSDDELRSLQLSSPKVNKIADYKIYAMDDDTEKTRNGLPFSGGSCPIEEWECVRAVLSYRGRIQRFKFVARLPFF